MSNEITECLNGTQYILVRLKLKEARYPKAADAVLLYYDE